MTTTYDKIVKHFNTNFKNDMPDTSKMSKIEKLAFKPYMSRPMQFFKQSRPDGEYIHVSYSLGLFKSRDIEAVLKKFKTTNIKSVSGTRGGNPSYVAKLPEEK